MAIATYNDLAAAVKTWCARSDSSFSAQIETFVALHELRMYNGCGDAGDALQCDALAAPEMETLSTVTFVAGVASVPALCSTIRTLGRPNDMIGIDYLTPRSFDILDANANGGDVEAFTIKGSNLYVTPAYDGTFNILFYKQQPAISSSNQTNTLLTAYPLIYFTGVMHEAFAFMQDIDKASAWFAKYRAAVSGVNGSLRGVRYGGMPLRMTARNAIP
jgi:hypothetical protein